MKKIFNKVVALSLFGVLSFHTILASDNNATIKERFKDAKFAELIASKLSKQVDDNVTQDDLDTITGASLVAGSSKLKSLEGISSLRNLKGIVISGSSLTSLPDEIGELSKLAEIDINGSDITNIPSSVSKLSDLTKLDLAQNKIEEVPTELETLSKLTKIDLSQNLITSVNGKLPAVQELNLSNNNLTKIDDNIESSTNLSLLNLSTNKIVSLSEKIDNLKNLTELQVNNNQITKTVPKVILKEGKISKSNMNNHTQYGTLDDITLYKDQSINASLFTPDLVKQIKEDNSDSLSTYGEWQITNPNKVKSVIKGGDGSEITAESFIDPGKYTVEFISTNKQQRYWGYSSFKVNVTVLDIKQPTELTIKLNGDATTKLCVHDKYVDAGATAKDSNSDVNVKVESNNVDTSKVGTYKVIYSVNNNHETKTVTRNVIVSGNNRSITKGNIVYHYQLKDNKWYNYKTIKTTKNIIETTSYNYNKSKAKTNTPTPLNGSIIKQKDIITKSGSKITKKQTIKYNRLAKKTSNVIHTLNSKKKFITTYKQSLTYHKNSKLKQNTSYNKNLSNKYTKKSKLVYRSSGKKQFSITFKYSNGKGKHRTEYVFNKNGELKSTKKYGKSFLYQTSYSKKGKALKTTKYTYNIKGKKTSKSNVKLRTKF